MQPPEQIFPPGNVDPNPTGRISDQDRRSHSRVIAFVFDQVRHFHRDLFHALEPRLEAVGAALHLFRGTEAGSNARGSVAEPVVRNETFYPLRDYRLGKYVFRLAGRYLAGIRNLCPKVVVCPAHPGDLGHWRLIRAKHKLGFRLVAWQCGYEYHPGRLKSLLTRRFVPGFDLHLAYHSNAGVYALRNGARPEQVRVIHNTIDEAAIVRLEKYRARELLLARHPAIGTRKIVLFVGALLAEKRVEMVVDAMRLRPDTDSVLLIVGGGPHEGNLRRVAAGRNDVFFTGQVIDGVGAYFDAADVYVLPGTGGLGINEAMAHGLPVISGYADGSADDLVIDGENGYRLREGTPEELAARIRMVLDDPHLAARMGARSREWITGKFSFQRFLDRVENGLLKCMDRSTPSP